MCISVKFSVELVRVRVLMCVEFSVEFSVCVCVSGSLCGAAVLGRE